MLNEHTLYICVVVRVWCKQKPVCLHPTLRQITNKQTIFSSSSFIYLSLQLYIFFFVIQWGEVKKMKYFGSLTLFLGMMQSSKSLWVLYSLNDESWPRIEFTNCYSFVYLQGVQKKCAFSPRIFSTFAAICRQENSQPIGVTVHSRCVDIFD